MAPIPQGEPTSTPCASGDRRIVWGDRLERRQFGAGQSEMTYGLGTQDGVIWIGWACGLRAETKATGFTGTCDPSL